MGGLLILSAGRHGEPPRYRCLCCPERVVFYAGEEAAYEAHVVACSRRHEDELRQLSIRARDPELFDPLVSGDVEFQAWVRANRKALLEGRRRM